MSNARIRTILDFGNNRGVFDGDMLVGFCGYRREILERMRHRAEIGPFFVSSSYQGSGAADVLMEGVVGEARQNGVEQLELFVDTKNRRAIRFYERHGFRLMATHLDVVRINGKPRDDYFYFLRL